MSLDITLALSICSFDLSQVGNQVVRVEYAQEKQETRACATMMHLVHDAREEACGHGGGAQDQRRGAL